ncbi:MAG: hypothetical protein K2P99_05400 [Burkholderiales bacterium]|nr:hypothetical protein [Burkholderiales bacterium]
MATGSAKDLHSKSGVISNELALEVCEKKEIIKYKHQQDSSFFAKVSGFLATGYYRDLDCKQLLKQKMAILW